MASTTCTHREQIKDIGQGLQEGTCSICGQVRRYNPYNQTERPCILKLGKIVGSIVLPGPKDVLKLSKEELLELQNVIKDGRRRTPSSPTVSSSAPVAPSEPMKRGDLHKYYEEHKAAIIEDYYHMRLKELLEKWHMSSLTWGRLFRKWKIESKGRGVRKAPKGRIKQGKACVGEKSSLPEFPAFNEQWSDLVKVAWFEAYVKL